MIQRMDRLYPVTLAPLDFTLVTGQDFAGMVDIAETAIRPHHKNP